MSLIADIIADDPVGMKQLRAARTLALPDWCIAAGFVRNQVWDHLHGISPPRPPADIDVLYYDASLLSGNYRNRFNWLEFSSSRVCSALSLSSWCSGAFSKSARLNICRIV